MLNLLTKSSSGNNNEAYAGDLNLSEDEIRQQMLQMNQMNKADDLPPAYSEEELQQNPSRIKKRFYRE